MKILLTVLIFLLLFSIIYIDDTIKKLIKEGKSNEFNYKKQKALDTIKNKEEYTKIQIQKAQQYLDEEAIASNNQS